MSRHSTSLTSLLPPGSMVMARKTSKPIASVPSERAPKALFFQGSPGARVLFIAEGLEQPELKHLLERMIAAIKAPEGEVALANVPSFPEFELGTPLEEIADFGSSVVVVLGAQLAHFLLESKLPLQALRGQLHERDGLKFLATHSLKELHENPGLKKESWADLQLILR